MKSIYLIALTLLLPGCLLELLTTTAIQGDLAAKSATQGQQVLHHTRDMAGKTELEQAIKLYAFDQEYYPARLDDLVPRYLPAVPMRGNGESFIYNPQTGQVLLQAETTTPRGGSSTMTSADMQNIELIRDSIYTYWQATGVYPESLDSLAPLYIDALPAMSSGGAFLYDPLTGAANHPAEFNVQAPTQGGATSQRKPKMIQENYSNSQLEALVELGI